MFYIFFHELIQVLWIREAKKKKKKSDYWKNTFFLVCLLLISSQSKYLYFQIEVFFLPKQYLLKKSEWVLIISWNEKAHQWIYYNKKGTPHESCTINQPKLIVIYNTKIWRERFKEISGHLQLCDHLLSNFGVQHNLFHKPILAIFL